MVPPSRAHALLFLLLLLLPRTYVRVHGRARGAHVHLCSPRRDYSPNTASSLPPPPRATRALPTVPAPFAGPERDAMRSRRRKLYPGGDIWKWKASEEKNEETGDARQPVKGVTEIM
uniref:Uncharacterized protein n=1 Tax=Arundo donax TaxID=35708 RepID=A0A0A9GGS2_ARUDO